MRDDTLERFKQRFRAEIRCARRAGYSAADVAAALEASREAVEAELDDLRWREALKAATTSQTSTLATKIRLAVAAAHQGRRDVAVMKVDVRRLVAARALLKAAGFVVEAVETPEVTWAPDVRAITFKLKGEDDE